MRPLIGIPLDYLDVNEEKEAEWYSKYPWYAVRYRYNDSIAKLGGMPCFIGYNYDLIPEYVEKFDGLIVAGGFFDHEPSFYNQAPHSTFKNNTARSRFEKTLLEEYLKTKKPILGICGGHQLINIVYGGTLFQDLESLNPTDIKHSGTNPPTEASHDVILQEGSKLLEWYGKDNEGVNSSHHQSIDKVGEGLIVSAVASDGIIEAIEDLSHPFCVGVQWHPEYLVSGLDEMILKKFIAACA